MNNILVRVFGYIATVLHGDAAVFDRWLWLRRHIQPGHLRTLDAGCGSGAFAMYAAKIGNDALGVSFDAENNKKASARSKLLGIKNIKFIQTDLRSLDEISEHLGLFDQIICFETIEHICNDKKLIKDIANLLKKNGKLFLITPYKHYKHLPGDKLSLVEDGGHVRWGYTHEEIKNILHGFNLKVQTEEYISGYISWHLIYFQRIFEQFHPKLAWLLVFPFRIFQWIDPFLSKIIHYPFLSIGVVASKL
jgi:SAM-dependent methyltransferase